MCFFVLRFAISVFVFEMVKMLFFYYDCCLRVDIEQGSRTRKQLC